MLNKAIHYLCRSKLYSFHIRNEYIVRYISMHWIMKVAIECMRFKDIWPLTDPFHPQSEWTAILISIEDTPPRKYVRGMSSAIHCCLQLIRKPLPADELIVNRSIYTLYTRICKHLKVHTAILNSIDYSCYVNAYDNISSNARFFNILPRFQNPLIQWQLFGWQNPRTSL